MTSSAENVLATRRENGGVARNDIASGIRRMEPEFQLAMPQGVEAKQLVRDALTMLRMSPGLAKCDQASVFGGLMTMAQLGLRPGVLGHGWLIPFKGKAQLIIGYQGYIELGARSGRVKSIVARTVFEGDTFDVEYGLANTLTHKPDLVGDRGKPVAYYAVAWFTDGGYAFHVMTHREVERHRDSFAMARKDGVVVGPWRDHFEAMAHKTTVRMMVKYMPKSTDMPQLGVAYQVDGGVRTDANASVEPAEATGFPADDVLDGEVMDAPQDGPQNDDQRKRLMALANTAGMGARESRLEWMSKTLGRPLESSKECTSNDMNRVIRALEFYLDGEAP